LSASFVLQLRQNIEIDFDFPLPSGCLVGLVVHLSRLKKGANGRTSSARYIKSLHSDAMRSDLEKLDREKRILERAQPTV
jgi:hypothetical protein